MTVWSQDGHETFRDEYFSAELHLVDDFVVVEFTLGALEKDTSLHDGWVEVVSLVHEHGEVTLAHKVILAILVEAVLRCLNLTQELDAFESRDRGRVDTMLTSRLLVLPVRVRACSVFVCLLHFNDIFVIITNNLF